MKLSEITEEERKHHLPFGGKIWLDRNGEILFYVSFGPDVLKDDDQNFHLDEGITEE